MAEETGNEALEKLATFVVQQMEAGQPKAAIVKKVIEMGVAEEEAESLVTPLFDETVKQAQAELFTPDSLVPAVLGGLLVAVLGGAIWGAVVAATNYEIGYLAWGLGLAAGLVVVKATGGKKGLIPQVIAVVSSVGGILLGKYFTFYYFFKQAVTKQAAANPAAEEFLKGVSVYSPEIIKTFLGSLKEIVTGHDALWIILAVFTAWSMAKAISLPAAILHSQPRDRI